MAPTCRVGQRKADDVTTRAKKTPGLTTMEAPKLSSQAADDSVAALERVREIEKTIPKPAPVDPREGIGRGLLSAEQSTWARLSPRHRNRWPKLAELDARVAELDQRQAALVRELETLQQRRSSVEQRHADRLADWYTAGQQGERPGSDANEVDEQLADARGEHDAIDRLRATVLAEKVAYVQRNRRSLAKTAATGGAKDEGDLRDADRRARAGTRRADRRPRNRGLGESLSLREPHRKPAGTPLVRWHEGPLKQVVSRAQQPPRCSSHVRTAQR